MLWAVRSEAVSAEVCPFGYCIFQKWKVQAGKKKGNGATGDDKARPIGKF
jgi:hypothetical protein